jgi:hypothetical protein
VNIRREVDRRLDIDARYRDLGGRGAVSSQATSKGAPEETRD